MDRATGPGHNQAAERAARLAAAREAYRRRRPQSAARFDAGTRHLPGANTRSVLHSEPFPLVFARGAGARLWDVDDFEYRDLLGEYTAGLFGHSDPVIRRALDRALDGGWSLGGHNLWQDELAQLICARFPAIERLRFTNSGTEANLMAVSLARAATGRAAILVFDGAYHGGVLGFAGGGSAINAPYEFLVAPYNAAGAAAALAERARGRLAAILVEPMLGAGGAIPGEPEFLHALRALATEHGGLLILDEVMTSRLAAGGRQAQLGLVPDLTTLGKYIGGGMSFGAFGGRADLIDRFDPRRPNALPHAGTFNNNVLSMAAGVAALGTIYTAEAAAALNARGDALRARFNAIGAGRGLPVQATGLGSIMTLHFTGAPIRRAADLAGAPPELRALLFLDMIEAGFYLAPRGLITLSLPLTDADLADALAAFEAFLDRHGDILAG